MKRHHGSPGRGEGNVFAAVGHVRYGDWAGGAVVHLYRDCYPLTRHDVDRVVKLKAAFLPDDADGCGHCRNRLKRESDAQQQTLAADGGESQ